MTDCENQLEIDRGVLVSDKLLNRSASVEFYSWQFGEYLFLSRQGMPLPLANSFRGLGLRLLALA